MGDDRFGHSRVVGTQVSSAFREELSKGNNV